MQTKIIESNTLLYGVKCEQYWPQSFTAESRYDDITVCCVPYEEWADCVVRVLEVTKEEYIFLHEVLTTPKYIRTPIELKRQVVNLTSSNNAENASTAGKIVEECQRMEEFVKEHIMLDADEGNVKENIHKNKSADALLPSAVNQEIGKFYIIHAHNT
ncbi:hypothetical protein EB796_013896 [Bugula neritina]|uniref:Tyrosine-protein phosphatase domain-containing protein n=1 Tax=Bugula neritina TaxID=10212 RepID=A0A7J7JQ37_BUGNE|nr:hypothetical protein EB796_013896 [Bugula neritina]